MRTFVEEYLLHYNAGALHRATTAYCDLIDTGGWMFLAMAGAASTAELGKILAPMIEAGKIHGISCTGANLEEDVFRLVGHDSYVELPEYQELTREEDLTLGEAGFPRVTDGSIPEQEAMRPVEAAVKKRWDAAKAKNARFFPHEPLYDLLLSGELQSQYDKDPADSWMLAAAKKNLPIVVPGWGDSTLGNHFAAFVRKGDYQPTLCKSDIEYFVWLSRWYQGATADHDLGFFQLGGGIAGDFPICVPPMLLADLKLTDVKKWAYFCQITDATESYGGYSGAMPQEKISWLKLEPKHPAFCIHSDYTIAFPLIGAAVLGW